MNNGIYAAGQCASAHADCARLLTDRRRKLQFVRCGGVVSRRQKWTFQSRFRGTLLGSINLIRKSRQNSCLVRHQIDIDSSCPEMVLPKLRSRHENR
jgi:hypothetical protein